MKFLIDTSVWSEALRRKNNSINSSQTILSQLLEKEFEIVLVGIILQEILSGITDKNLFTEINIILSGFSYIETTKQDYIYAAEIRNIAKSKGITAGSFDYLIASLAVRNNLTLVSLDKDFINISKHCDLKLFNFKEINAD